MTLQGSFRKNPPRQICRGLRTMCCWICLLSVLSGVWACAPCRTGGIKVAGQLPNRLHYTIRQRPDAEPATASLSVRIDCDSQEDLDTAHLLEHVLLRELRETDLPFIFSAATTPQQMSFRCTFFPERLSPALRTLARVLDTPSREDRTIAGALDVIGHELRRHAVPVAPEELRKFHREHFVASRISLDIAMPSVSGEVIPEIESDFAGLAGPTADASSVLPCRRGEWKCAYLSLTDKTIAILSQKIGAKNATAAVFLPKPGPDHDCLHRTVARATRRWQGEMMCDDGPDYYVAAAAVRQLDFAVFLREIARGDRSEDILGDPKARAWNRLCTLVARRDKFSPKTVILVSGDFPMPVLEQYAINIHAFLQRLPPRDLEIPRPPDPDLSYVMAMVATPGTDRMSWEMLAVSVRRNLYLKLVIPGLAYRMGCHYQPMLGHGVLGVWVETTPQSSLLVRQTIADAIAAARTPVSSLEWQVLVEKARLYYLLQRDSALKRDYHRCLDTGTRSFGDCLDPGQFARRQDEYLAPGRWSFWISPTARD